MDVKNRVAIIGAGLIGRSWAIVFAGGAFDVTLYDLGLDIAEKARGLVTQGLIDLAEQGLIDDPKAAAARVRVAGNLADALDAVDLVQESLPESIETKRSSVVSWRNGTKSSRPIKSPRACVGAIAGLPR